MIISVALGVTAHSFGVVGTRPESPLPGQVILHSLLVERDALGLVADNAVQSPREESHPLGQDRLQMPLGREALQGAGEV